MSTPPDAVPPASKPSNDGTADGETPTREASNSKAPNREATGGETTGNTAIDSEAPEGRASAVEAPDGPLTLRLAVLGLWIEAIFLVGLTVFQLVEVFVASPSNPGVAVVLAGLTGALAVLLYRIGVLLTERRSWPRGVAIVVQLLVVPVAYFMATGEGGPVVAVSGVVLGGYALACAGLLLAPASRLALRRR